MTASLMNNPSSKTKFPIYVKVVFIFLQLIDLMKGWKIILADLTKVSIKPSMVITIIHTALSTNLFSYGHII